MKCGLLGCFCMGRGFEGVTGMEGGGVLIGYGGWVGCDSFSTLFVGYLKATVCSLISISYDDNL